MAPDTDRQQLRTDGPDPGGGLARSSDTDDARLATEPWRRLQTKLLSLLASRPRDLWIEMWRLFLDDPWYLAELARQAHFAIRAARAPPDWEDELFQEAILYLASELQRRPDLRLDSRGCGAEFPGRIRAMIRNDCRQALKRMRRLYGTAPAAARLLENVPSDMAITQSLALHAAIAELPEPESSVVRLYFAEYRIGQIAESLGLTYWETWRAFWNAIRQLRDDLS